MVMPGLEGLRVTTVKDVASFDVDLRIYPLDAVLGTAYVFINRTYVHLDQPAANRVRVALAGKQPLDAAGLRALCGEFLNELLGQVLRERASTKYGRMREALLAKALFSAAPGLAADDEPAPEAAPADGPETPPEVEAALADLPPEAEYSDYLEDPLGIAMSWEEKYGAKKDDKGNG
jgi:His-Xaa-Ser system protein HxsD